MEFSGEIIATRSIISSAYCIMYREKRLTGTGSLSRSLSPPLLSLLITVKKKC